MSKIYYIYAAFSISFRFITCGGKTHPSLVGGMRAAKILKKYLDNSKHINYT